MLKIVDNIGKFIFCNLFLQLPFWMLFWLCDYAYDFKFNTPFTEWAGEARVLYALISLLAAIGVVAVIADPPDDKRKLKDRAVK